MNATFDGAEKVNISNSFVGNWALVVPFLLICQYFQLFKNLTEVLNQIEIFRPYCHFLNVNLVLTKLKRRNGYRRCDFVQMQVATRMIILCKKPWPLGQKCTYQVNNPFFLLIILAFCTVRNSYRSKEKKLTAH